MNTPLKSKHKQPRRIEGPVSTKHGRIGWGGELIDLQKGYYAQTESTNKMFYSKRVDV